MSPLGAMMSRTAAETAGQVRAWWKRGVLEAALTLCFALAALSGVVLIAVGGYASLSALYAPWIAGVAIGGIVLLLSIAGLLIVSHTDHAKAPAQQAERALSPPPRHDPQIDTVAQIGEYIGASLNNGNVKTIDVTIAALVAGTVLGASPALRERIFKARTEAGVGARAPTREYTGRGEHRAVH
jgi:small-conductance mechanosensitive channel